MRYILAVLLVMVAVSVSFADQRVKGYYRDSDGDGYRERYVDSYNRTTPNNNPYDNYSTRGNTNPYTGQPGYVDPYRNQYNNSYKNRSRY